MLVVQVLRAFAVEDFFSYKSRKRRIFFLQTSYIKDTYVEAYEFRQGWSVAKIRGTRKLRRRPRKVVCLREKGTSETRKEKRPSKARRWLPQRKGSVCPTPRNSFLVHEYLGSERPVSFEYRLLRDFVYEEAMCKGNSGNGLPYAAKAVP